MSFLKSSPHGKGTGRAVLVARQRSPGACLDLVARSSFRLGVIK